MKRYAKDAEKTLLELGFDHIWTNTSGGRCYAHPDDPCQEEVVLNPAANENAARTLLRRARRIVGARAEPDSKRNADRERAQRRLAYVLAKHRRLLEGHAPPENLAAAKALIEQRETELAAIERLMRQPPAGGHDHRGTGGQPRHYTGPTT